MDADAKQPYTAAEDEDLFDFPDMTVFDPLLAPGQEAPSALPEPAAQPKNEAPQAVRGDAGPLDVDLDEDLFGFDDALLTARSAPVEGAVHESDPAVETALDDAPEVVVDELLPPLEEPTLPAAEGLFPPGMTASDLPPLAPVSDQATSPPAATAPAPSPVRPRRNVFTRGADTAAQAPAFATAPEAPVLVPAGFEEGRRGRLVELLALVFLLGNTALVVFAWRARGDFQDTLVHVTRTVADAIADGQSRAQEQPAVRPSAPVQPVESTRTESAPDVPLEPTNLSRFALELAKEQLSAGEFEAGRQALFRLLASQDRSALPREVIAEAEILIARSFQLQGAALREGRR